MKRYICIHGHFYQPPRENPWLDIVEGQDSAYPYHDWNARITEECYAPNTASRILNAERRIVRLNNNYSGISFDFGPTLLSWMEKKAPDTYQAILKGDLESRECFSGHGGALAQAYNHMIMPLAHPRDKQTQIIWGIEDFRYRFGRKPEGLWLPETAVDLETLDLLAAGEIRFTILAPGQARRFRPIGGKQWKNVDKGKIDTTMPYAVRLPSGKSMALFFYDGAISQAIAFEGLLGNGKSFFKRLMAGFANRRKGAQLVHVATDGESYGHHHRYGDTTLARLLHELGSSNEVGLTTYGEFLEMHPPSHEVEIFENTAWSCAHGVERWRSDCGCHSGAHPDWNQSWRAPMRQALDWLRDRLASLYERAAGRFFAHPWEARNLYIQVILDRSADKRRHFLKQVAKRPLTAGERIRVFKLMELQRHAMLMYTSCGWFFDDIAGIEAIQNLRHAGYTLELARELFGKDLESGFLEILSRAQSNRPEEGDGRRIFETHVNSARFDGKSICAQAAIGSLFNSDSQRNNPGCYSVHRTKHRPMTSEKAVLVLGQNRVVDARTGSSDTYDYAVLHSGSETIRCGLQENRRDADHRLFVKALADIFSNGSFRNLQSRFDAYFNPTVYTLKSVTHDERQRILKQILTGTLDAAETTIRGVYRQTSSEIPLIADSGVSLRALLLSTQAWVLNTDLERAFEQEIFDMDHIRGLLRQAAARRVALDTITLGHSLRCRLERMTEQLLDAPQDLERVRNLDKAVALIQDLPFSLDLWRVQKHCVQIADSTYGAMVKQAEKGDPGARRWVSHFQDVADRLSIFLRSDGLSG